MPAIYRRDAASATGSSWRRATKADDDKDWFQSNSTILYIIISALLTILTLIVLFLVWRIVLRKKLRAWGLCVPTSRRRKLTPNDEADHSDPYSTPYADAEGQEEMDDEERWRRRTIRIEWADPAKRRSSLFVGKVTQPAWDEGRDRLLFDGDKETGYGYDGRADVRGKVAKPYDHPAMSPLSHLQASIPRMAYGYRQSTQSAYAPSFTSSFGHTPDQSQVGRSGSAASGTTAYHTPAPNTRAPQAIHLLAPRSPYNPFSDPEPNTIAPLASIASMKPDLKPHYHPYPLFATTATPVVVVVPQRNPPPAPLYLPCPINTSGTPSLSSSASTLSSRSPSTPHRHPYPISTTPVNYRPPPRTPESPSSPPDITITTPESSPEGFSESEPPASPWQSFRHSFRPKPPPKHTEEDEYDHYQLPIIRPGSAFVPFPPNLNFLDKEHRDRARDRMSHISVSNRSVRTTRMYEELWEEYGDESEQEGQAGQQGRVVSSIYPPMGGVQGKVRRASFATARMSRKSMLKPSPLRQINEV